MLSRRIATVALVSAVAVTMSFAGSKGKGGGSGNTGTGTNTPLTNNSIKTSNGNGNPSYLQVGSAAGTTCAGAFTSTSCYLWTNEAVGYNNSDLSLYLVSGSTDVTKLDLVLAVPVKSSTDPEPGSAFSALIIPTVTEYNPYSGYPGNAQVGTATFVGDLGDMTSVHTSDTVYKVVFGSSFTGDASDNWANYTGADAAINAITGIDHFDIYEYQLNLPTFPLAGKGLVDVNFGKSVNTFGDFAVGVGTIGSNSYALTPFTHAGLGLTPPVVTPEPGGLILFATGLLGAAGVLRRRFRM